MAMTISRLIRFSVSPSLLLSVLITASAQPLPDEPPGRWQLEALTLKDQSQIRGLIQSQTAAEIDFAQVIQPPGKPMYAVIRVIPRTSVTKIERLDEAEHLALFRRIALFRNRAVIEAGRMDQLELTSQSAGGSRVLHYAGPWFELTSTADDEQTRRCLVRIEQFFRAYRTLLPPRIAQPKPLRVQLFGSLDQYRDRLRDLNLDLENAALYSPREATILAASDLNLFAERLAQVRREHERVRKDLARLDDGHEQKLATLADELKAAGYTPDEIRAEQRQRKASWKKELETTLATNVQRERSAEQKFDVVTDKMFRSLAHESFHAWLDTFVYPHDRHDGRRPELERAGGELTRPASGVRLQRRAATRPPERNARRRLHGVRQPPLRDTQRAPGDPVDGRRRLVLGARARCVPLHDGHPGDANVRARVRGGRWRRPHVRRVGGLPRRRLVHREPHRHDDLARRRDVDARAVGDRRSLRSRPLPSRDRGQPGSAGAARAGLPFDPRRLCQRRDVRRNRRLPDDIKGRRPHVVEAAASHC